MPEPLDNGQSGSLGQRVTQAARRVRARRDLDAIMAERDRYREALLAIARLPHYGGDDSSEVARERGRLAREALR